MSDTRAEREAVQVALTPCRISTDSRFKDLTGQRFGRLIVTGLAGKRRYGNKNYYFWNCQCDCGEMCTSATYRLTGGQTSCGCLANENSAVACQTHGETVGGKASTELTIFMLAKARCTNPRNPAYPHYGGRGIEFRFASFNDFLKHIGRRPSHDYTLDRINNDGHYESGNVRWATRQQQAQNTRGNRYLTHQGRKMLASQWAASLGICQASLNRRLKRWCWDCVFQTGRSTCRHRRAK